MKSAIQNSHLESYNKTPLKTGLDIPTVCSVDVVTVSPPPAVDGGPVGDVEDEEEDREHAEEHQVRLRESEQKLSKTSILTRLEIL